MYSLSNIRNDLTLPQNRIEAAKVKKATLESDVQKFNTYIDNLLQAITQAKQRLQDCQKEIEVRGKWLYSHLRDV